MGIWRRMLGDLGTGLDHDWQECDRPRCAELLCQVYWAGYADGNAAGYGTGLADGQVQGYAAGLAAAGAVQEQE